MSRPRTIVIGIVDETSIDCIPEEQFLGLAALRTCKTWGELRRAEPDFVRNEVEARYADPDSIPGDDIRLDLYDIPGAADGDWPWPAADMLDWLPKDIQAEFGEERSITLNGNCLLIDAIRIEELTTALQSRGSAMRREDPLVSRIAGY